MFISHAKEDGRVAEDIAKALRRLKFTTWTYEENSTPGISWLEQAHDAIKPTDAVVLIASHHSIRSPQVIMEVEQAQSYNKLIFPILVGISHAQFCDADPILRMACGTKVSLSTDGVNADAIAEAIANGVRLAAGRRPPAVTRDHHDTTDSHFELAYDSVTDDGMESWVGFSSIGGADRRVFREVRQADSLVAWRLRAFGSEHVGVNKSFFKCLHGKVTFDYRIDESRGSGERFIFFMIPMRDSPLLLEVGSDVEGDPKNGFSPHRVAFTVPQKHFCDDRWHEGTLVFDFRAMAEAGYSIFAPRINEGTMHADAGVLLIAKVRLYASAS